MGTSMKAFKAILIAGVLGLGATMASAQSLEGTARLFFTTSSGVSNYSNARTGANTLLQGTSLAARINDTSVKVTRLNRQ